MAVERRRPGASTATGTAKPHVRISELCVQFGGETRDEGLVTAVDKASFGIDPGEIVCLVGPSGCGKSTILNVIGGAIVNKPTKGVYVSGHVEHAVEDVPDNQRVGYMFQEDTLLPWKTAIENVLLPLRLTKHAKPHDRAMELLDMTGLTRFADHYPRQLSGGMRKRIQMAQLLAHDAQLLLLDEPFGALDALTKVLMQQEFLRVWERERKSILFVTHDLTEAILLGDRILSMSAHPGRIRRQLPVDIARPRPDVASLIATREYASLYGQLWHDLNASAQGSVDGAPHDHGPDRDRSGL